MSFNAWDLQVPIKLVLASNEISSPVTVKPVYRLAPRQGYLPTLALQALPYFQHVLLSLPGQDNVMPWFEYQGLPLLWTLPIGVLFDLLMGPEPCLPWVLTVHYHHPPANITNSWQNRVSTKEHLFNSLKEASYICRGADGSNAVMRMSGSDHDALWSAVERGDGTAYLQCLRPLKVVPSVRQGSGPYIPVRVFLRQKDTRGDLIGNWALVESTSRMIEALQPNGEYTQLAELLRLVAPQRFEADCVITAGPGTGAVAAVAATLVAAAATAGGAEGDASQGPDRQGRQGEAGVLGSTGEQHQELAGATAEPEVEGWAAKEAAGGPEVAEGPSLGSGAASNAAEPPGGEASGGPLAADTACAGPGSSQKEGPGATCLGDIGTDAVALSSSSSSRRHSHGGGGEEPSAGVETAEMPVCVSMSAGHHGASACSVELPGWVVIVAGVQPPLHSPLAWLHQVLAAADQFLYVAVLLPT